MIDNAVFRGKSKDKERILEIMEESKTLNKCSLIGTLNGKHVIGINLGIYSIHHLYSFKLIIQFFLRDDLDIVIGNMRLGSGLEYISPESFKDEYYGLWRLYEEDTDKLIDAVLMLL